MNIIHNLSPQTKQLSFHYRVETAFPIGTILSEQIPASEFRFIRVRGIKTNKAECQSFLQTLL